MCVWGEGIWTPFGFLSVLGTTALLNSIPSLASITSSSRLSVTDKNLLFETDLSDPSCSF